MVQVDLTKKVMKEVLSYKKQPAMQRFEEQIPGRGNSKDQSLL